MPSGSLLGSPVAWMTPAVAIVLAWGAVRVVATEAEVAGTVAMAVAAVTMMGAAVARAAVCCGCCGARVVGSVGVAAVAVAAERALVEGALETAAAAEQRRG